MPLLITPGTLVFPGTGSANPSRYRAKEQYLSGEAPQICIVNYSFRPPLPGNDQAYGTLAVRLMT